MKYKVNSIYCVHNESYLDVHYWFEVRLDHSDDIVHEYDYEPEWKKYPEYSWEEEWDDSEYPPLFDDLDPDDLVDIDFDDF